MTLLNQLKVDTETNDLDISTGNLVVVTGVDSLVQRIRTRLQTFLGECFLDASLGVPYFQQIFKDKNPRVSALNAAFGDAILSVDGVERILSLNYALDSVTRKLSVDFKVLSESGETSESSFETGV
jgi:hypothetical protein